MTEEDEKGVGYITRMLKGTDREMIKTFILL